MEEKVELSPCSGRIAILGVCMGLEWGWSGVGVSENRPPPAARPPGTVSVPQRDTVWSLYSRYTVCIEQVYNVYRADIQCAYTRYTVCIQLIYSF